jgi:hypothetical protein
MFGQSVKVYGKLTDTKNRPLSGEVKVLETNETSITNSDGSFTFYLPKNDTYTLKFSSLNHFTRKSKITIENSDKNIGSINLQLRSLAVVVVETEQQGITIDKIKPPELGSMPSGTGNFEDYIKISGLGVSSNNELTSNYNVRGGNYDENLIYVNGIEIYRPFLARSGQQEGLSFINSAFVENIYFSAGGFDAYYGDKLSSVLDIKYREPNSFGGSAQFSLMGGQAHIEGVFGKAGRGNYITGVRYRSNSYLLNGLPTQGDYNPTFFDYQFLTNYYTVYDNENSYQKLYFLGHFSTNDYAFIPSTRTTSFGTVNEAYQFKVYFDGQESTKFQTFTGAAGYQWRVNKKLNLHFVASSFNSNESENFDINGEYFINQLETDPAKEEFGDSTQNVGVGGFLDHGRNTLNVWIANAYHFGKYDFTKKTYKDNNKYHFASIRWGAKFQNEEFNDKLSEWHTIDSAGYAIPQGSNNSIDLIDVIKTKNNVSTQRITSHFQYTLNFINKKDVSLELKTKIKTDSSKYFITRIDTIKNSPSKIALSIGERTGYRTLNDEFWFTPRLNLSFFPRQYMLNEDSTITRRNVKFKFSSGLYYQPPLYRDMRNFEGNINNVVSQKSWHNVIGADIYFKMWGRPFKFITEAYYKHLWDVNSYEIDNVRIRYYANNDAVAYAYGVDAKINGEFIKGIESSFKIGILQTKEDIQNDFYYTYFNSDGDTIYPGYTFNNTATDSTLNLPGYIPRPSEQLFTFGLFFQDQMPRFPNFKVSINLLFGSPLPYGPPSHERYRDILRTKSYFRTDIGFIYDIINQENQSKFKDKAIFKHFDRLSASFNAFNLMGVKNIISYQWLQDISGNYYAIPNHLTGLRLNLKLVAEF